MALEASTTGWSYDPWDAATIADPYAVYGRLREERCHHNEELGFYALARYEDVASGLRDHARLSSADGVGLHGEPDLVLVGEDQPGHTKSRRLATHPFTKQGLARHVDRMEAEAGRLIDRAIEARAVDVVSEIADPYVTSTLAHVLGLPDTDREAWLLSSQVVFDRICARDEPFDLAESEALREVFMRVDAVVEERKLGGEHGGGDIIDAVVSRAEADADGWRLNRAGRALFVGALIAPGLQTTRHMVSSGFELISRFPEQWRRVREGEVELELFVEEIFRYESPIQGFFRVAREPIDIGGRVIPAGGRVLMLFGSANRDERVFDDAATFRVDRSSSENVTFGAGIHYCLGAGLARLEAKALFGALRDRVSRVELNKDGAVRETQALLRGWSLLPTELLVS